MPIGLPELILAGVFASPAGEGEDAPADTASPEDADGSDLEWDGEDMDDFLSGFEDEDAESASEEAELQPERPDVATGAMRMMGAYLHFPDVPELYPAGDDAIAAGVLRMIVDQELGEHLEYEMNVFGDLSRSPPLGGFGGSFQTAGGTQSAYRSPHLSWAYWENGAIRGTAGLDRFALRAHGGRFNFALGRFPVNYSVTNFFTPNDLFSPFSATAINRVYKPGVDAAQFSVGIGALSAAEVVAVMGYDDDGAPDWGRAAVMGRLSAVFWNFEWAALGGKIAERWFAGASLQGDIGGPVGLVAEAHVGFPDENGDGKLDDGADPYVRAAAGPSLTLTWQNAMIAAEYGFYMDGASDPDDYLERVTEFYPDDVPYLGQHYVGGTAGLEIIPILRVNAITLVNAGDGSGMAGGFLMYNIADEADFVGGVYVPWGDRPSFEGFPIVPPSLGSEFGAGALAVFLETRFYF
jgi:hypothetical protein